MPTILLPVAQVVQGLGITLKIFFGHSTISVYPKIARGFQISLLPPSGGDQRPSLLLLRSVEKCHVPRVLCSSDCPLPVVQVLLSISLGSVWDVFRA